MFLATVAIYRTKKQRQKTKYTSINKTQYYIFATYTLPDDGPREARKYLGTS